MFLRFQAATNAGARNAAQAYYYLDRLLEITPDSTGALEAKVNFGLRQGEDLTVIRSYAENPLVRTHPRGHFSLWLLSIHERRFAKALEFLDLSADDVWQGRPKPLFYAVTHQLAGQLELAEPHFEAAKDQLELKLNERPGDWDRTMDLAETMVGLGESQEGESLAEDAMQLMPPSRDHISGKTLQAEAILRVFVPAGNFARATELLETQLESPAAWALEGLLADPRLDPIRDDPQFQVVVERYR
jgi:hypothetical protein